MANSSSETPMGASGGGSTSTCLMPSLGEQSTGESMGETNIGVGHSSLPNSFHISSRPALPFHMGSLDSAGDVDGPAFKAKG